jgi:putative adenylate-forming enzyme
MLESLRILSHYFAARRLDRESSRRRLLEHQFRQFEHLREALRRSPFYRDYACRPLSEWPLVDKAAWMANFDSINTAGIRLRDAEQVALSAERNRSFNVDLRGVTVGLSTGTSGARGVFLASNAERRRWAGAILAKLLPKGLLQRERIALVLRADSRLYGTVASGRWMQFGYFDSTQPIDEVATALVRFSPTVLVGPPSVLRALVTSTDIASRLRVRRLVCGAEVLDDTDRALLHRTFDAPVAQVYQATEGFLGASCSHGTLHLNEEYVHVEPQWLDAARTRFVPVITDLYRHTQPVVRYRLNDVLTIASAPCPCGKASLAIDRIEGREDDVFWLPALDPDRGAVPIFADALSRAIVTSGASIEDYEIVQTERTRWRVAVHPAPDADACKLLSERLQHCAHRGGAIQPQIDVTALTISAPTPHKRRRIRREWQGHAA